MILCVEAYNKGQVVLAVRRLLRTTRFHLIHQKSIDDFYVRRTPMYCVTGFWIHVRQGFYLMLARNVGGGYAELSLANDDEIRMMSGVRGGEVEFADAAIGEEQLLAV